MNERNDHMDDIDRVLHEEMNSEIPPEVEGRFRSRLAEFQERMDERELARGSRWAGLLSLRGNGFRRAIGVGAVAAAVVLAILAGQLRLGPGRDVRTAPMEITDPEVKTFRLADGSVLKVHPGSRVAWSLGEESRDLYLYRGEVFLDVKAENREFRVLTPSATVSVLGTRFQVRVSPGEGEVSQP
jgi:ferric-dicitrate binding protein FerR (iron transport regulator)